MVLVVATAVVVELSWRSWRGSHCCVEVGFDGGGVDIEVVVEVIVIVMVVVGQSKLV